MSSLPLATAPAPLFGRNRGGIGEGLRPLGARPFVAQQVFRWLYARRALAFAEMSDLPLRLREELALAFRVGVPEVSERVPASDDTLRYVYRLDDGERTESVWIPGADGQATLCLSSQVGCPLACTFCVSGVAGVRRNLSTGEILGQAHAMLREHPPLRRVNVVFMGMGEALLNLDAVGEALAILSDPEGFDIALRRMTLSTAGHVPALERFAALPQRPRLAISLNAASDEVRSSIMPINRAWPIATLLAALRRLPLARGERITFEYVLLRGINDGESEARRLPKLLHGIPSKLNLIPWNPSPGLPYDAPAPAAVERFAQVLKKHGLRVTVRRRRGAEAGAACGQLALQRPRAEPEARS